MTCKKDAENALSHNKPDTKREKKGATSPLQKTRKETWPYTERKKKVRGSLRPRREEGLQIEARSRPPQLKSRRGLLTRTKKQREIHGTAKTVQNDTVAEKKGTER